MAYKVLKGHKNSRLFLNKHKGIVLGLLILALTGCTLLPAGTAPVVRIGLIAPFEGHHRKIGYDVIYAARLAIREWNGRGGIGGYRVELVAVDDGGNPEMALRAAQSMGTDQMVVGVIGHWLAETTGAARPAYTVDNLPLIPMDETAVSAGEPSERFVAAYGEVAPFAEQPGRYALPAYDACNRLIEAIGEAIAAGGEPTRDGVAAALRRLETD
jgi:ABC-type branched-subunit amino acid transport system substrate-binding protein